MASHRSIRSVLQFIVTVTILLAFLHVYIGWRLLPAFQLHATGEIIGMAILFFSTLLIPSGLAARFLITNPALSDRISWIGLSLMGFFSSVLVLTLLRDLSLLFFHSLPFITYSAITVPVLAALVTLLGLMNARSLPKIIHVDIPLEALPDALVGFKIVQLSDIHVGPTIKSKYVRAIVERANTLNADLIAITGDVVDGSVQQLSDHTAPLAALISKYGSYIVTGNHEYYSGVNEWMTEFKRLGLHILMNEHEVLTHAGQQLVIAGITDYTAAQFIPSQKSDPVQALLNAPIQAGIPKILLAHQPRSAQAAAEAGFDVQLSGHTHGGQFWPWNHFVRFQQPFTSGLHRLGKLWVYTSRGTGYWGPPKRFGAPAEITCLHLTKAI